MLQGGGGGKGVFLIQGKAKLRCQSRHKNRSALAPHSCGMGYKLNLYNTVSENKAGAASTKKEPWLPKSSGSVTLEWWGAVLFCSGSPTFFDTVFCPGVARVEDRS